MEETIAEKYHTLIGILKRRQQVLVAYSGGVDSSLLLYVAARTLGTEHVLAVTADSETFTREELAYTRMFTEKYAIPHRVVTTCELAEINRHGNSRDRCYYCKRELFDNLQTLAKEGGYTVIEGSNLDDSRDYRPGSRALNELNISSPLKEAGLTKAEIRTLSRELALPSWDKPAYACLTSRFPYNVPITEPELNRVEAAEKYLHQLGYLQCRVRHYGSSARIEVAAEQLADALAQSGKITAQLKQLGYQEVTIDPRGYRMGSMNVFNNGA